ncbi:MAG TPA: glutathione S-transferase family protein [Polyangiales bacterium]|nr:glutathione S-transferase family protein [Polyangiales bacterium]
MNKPKLTYFDAPVSRGEECRLAFHVAGVDFEDNRIPGAAWGELKPKTPFGALPVLELEGRPPLAESNAILTLIGRRHGLHPEDLFEAARHEALLSHAESLRHQVTPSLRISDEVEKKKAREALATAYLPAWGASTERQLGDGPFVAGKKLNVVDIKLYMIVRWFASGTVDHVPATVFAAFPKLTRLYEAVRDDARVKAWSTRQA